MLSLSKHEGSRWLQVLRQAQDEGDKLWVRGRRWRPALVLLFCDGSRAGVVTEGVDAEVRDCTESVRSCSGP